MKKENHVPQCYWKRKNVAKMDLGEWEVLTPVCVSPILINQPMNLHGVFQLYLTDWLDNYRTDYQLTYLVSCVDS